MFIAAVDADLIWLAVVGAIASVVSAFYYLRIVWIMWFDEPALTFEREGGPFLGLTAASSALLMFPVLTIFIGLLREVAMRAASSIF